MDFNEKLQLEGLLMNAILRGEKSYSYFKPVGGAVFVLPDRQSSGTLAQQETYARLAAKKLIEETYG